MDAPYFVYLLRCKDGSLYTGISNDLARRLKVHNSGRGALYVRLRGPAKMVWYMYAGSHSYALRLEHVVKKHTRAQKEEIIAGTRVPVLFLPKEGVRFFHL
jgi:putative endonuclease